MIDFGKVVYLDVQKTGSSFVSRFLRANLALPEIARHLHAPAPVHRPESFYFITVREPLAQYISLFQYGLQGRGGMVQRFRDAGLADFYQPDTRAFERWLGFMIAPENAPFFGPRYLNARPELLGLQSYRFLTLSFVNASAILAAATSKARLNAIYARHKLHTLVIKTETLNRGLENLLDSEVGPFFKPRKEVVSYLQNSKQVKKSAAVAGFLPEKIKPDLIANMKKREWFLYENFYPQE